MCWLFLFRRKAGEEPITASSPQENAADGVEAGLLTSATVTDKSPLLMASAGQFDGPYTPEMNGTELDDPPSLQKTSVINPSVVAHQTPRSPLLFDAFSEHNFSLVEALIEENRGLLFVSHVQSGNTVLHAAVLHDAPTRIIKELVEKGADINRPNDMGRTPVYIAARHNVRIETMRYLISVGGDVNRRDNYEYTPLMASAYNGASLSLVAGLLALGGDMSMVDSQNRKARDWALEGQHGYIATFLDNIMMIPALCSVYVPRLGGKSPLKILPKDLMRQVRNALCVPTKKPEGGVTPATNL